MKIFNKNRQSRIFLENVKEECKEEVVKNFKDLHFLKIDWDKGFNLFLHGEEDEGKTEDPTETKKKKSREEGQVFLTQDLPQSGGFILALSVIFIFSSYYFKEMSRYLQKHLENREQIDINQESLVPLLVENIWIFAKLILPVGLTIIVSSIFLTMIQTKFLVSFKNLKFNFKKIAPSWKNFLEKTIFSRTQVLNSVKIIFKLIFTILLTYFFLYYLTPDLWALVKLNAYQALSKSLFWIFEIGIYLGLLLLVLSLPDWFIQKAEYIRKIKMTKDEVKREIKELEGDPQIKQKQRERAKEIAKKDMVGKVKEADVLITNPTHFACAIRYDREYMDAPKVIAKGMDFLALKMRSAAQENNIPIVENKPLARAIYQQVEIDEYIPPEFYFALSEILKTLDKFKNTPVESTV